MSYVSMVGKRSLIGFTLIELLVVITIVSVLLAMLLPVMSKSRQMAKFMLCASNMRQVGVVYIVYETDYKAYPLPGNIPERVSPTGEEVEQYISSRKMWYCPDRETFLTLGSDYPFQPVDWPRTGYFNFAGAVFPEGLKTRYPGAYNALPRMWYHAYYPFAQDIMRGYMLNPATGEYGYEDLNRVAHSEAGKLLRSNAVRHDGSVSSKRYFMARNAGGSFNGYTYPGSINNGSSIMYHVVDPAPFGPPTIEETFEP